MAQNRSTDDLSALNRHGVLFKKRVLQELRSYEHLDLLGEELGVTFGGVRVLDMAFRCNSPEKRRLVFSIECKRVFGAKWVFFRDCESRFRVSRDIREGRNGSAIDLRWESDVPCCSEGYEIRENGGTISADQDPIFKAASQLSYGFLGFVKRRLRESEHVENLKGWTERHIPVLVTNAKLFVAPSDYGSVDLATGNLTGEWNLTSEDIVALNHPSPSPGELDDFREDSELDTWNHLFKETLWIVHSNALPSYFGTDRCRAAIDFKSGLCSRSPDEPA